MNVKNRFCDALGSMAQTRALILGTTLLVCLICVAGLEAGSRAESGTDTASNHASGAANAAINRFWTAYHGNDYGAISQVEGELARAIRLNPKNATLYALLGAAHFWHYGEYTRDPQPNQQVLQQDLPTAVTLFQNALDLDYYSPHQIGYVNDDHLPGYLGIVTVHTGQQFRDPALIAEGDKILDFAAYQFPEFNNFNRWAAHNTDPKDSDSYRKALDSLWEGIDSCAGTKIDRINPDLKPYLNLFTSVGRKKACWWGGEIAPYSIEGYMLNLGNGLVKAGQIEAARVVFDNAKYAANYGSWPYRGVLEEIEVSDLYARAAMYSDGRLNSFGVPNRGCVYCHATGPERNSR